MRAADTAPTQPMNRLTPIYQNPHVRGIEYEYPRWVTTRHRIAVAVMVAVITAAFYVAQHLLWPHSSAPRGWLAEAWSWLGILWALPFIPAKATTCVTSACRGNTAHPTERKTKHER